MLRFTGRALLCLFAASFLSFAAVAQEAPAVVAPEAAAAAPEAAEDALISNVFIDTDLRQALQDVAAQAGVNIIAEPSVQGLVSVELDTETVDRALELILAGSGYEVARFPNYYLVFSADQSSDVFTDVAQTLRQRVYNIPAASARTLLPDPLQRYVRVDEAANALVITAPRLLMERILADLGKIDLPPSEGTTVVALNHVRSPTALSQLPRNLQTFVSADAERNTLAVTAPIGTRELVINYIRQLDVPRGAGSFGVPDVHRTEVVKLNHAKALATMNLLPASLAAYVRADEESNTLAVSAPGILLGGILEDIAAIDVPRKHIMLDARVVVLERLDLLNFGADWRFPVFQAGASISDLPGSPGSFVSATRRTGSSPIPSTSR